ncbi:phage head morphogenesis protein [Viridibacillus sp. FSL H7-0596]|uniref:phage minor head protein n=1 Tax=Viridibacillus sp. FSL H7-0596 TaxID=1928923 RepID=UPI00096CFD3F|nr:phage minor head protein [Viridibacillus sp. FSL H7-0596]OMC86920.1 phage head morphogenesis protein [Viridibacillus sp. FSL H7-0596]
MDQLEINEELDKLMAQTESDIEKLFAKRLKSILAQMSTMYFKLSQNGQEPSWTDVNKYNRFQQEMKRIAQQLDSDYRKLILEITKSHQTLYVEKYLMMAYLFSMSNAEELGFQIPSESMIQTALINPVEYLTLPKIFEFHRRELIRKLNIEIAQSLQQGLGYSDLAYRIQQVMGFSRKKAILVARTEGGRVRSLADLQIEEDIRDKVNLDKAWMSSLDLRVRSSHRKLDGQKADGEGYFHHLGLKAKGPHMWGVANMDIQCRCTVIYLVDGKYPEYRRGRDYMDTGYQRKLASRTEKYMADEGLTYKQALKKAQKELQPPSTVIPFVTFPDWRETMAA